MLAIVISCAVALAVSLFATPLYIRFLVRRDYGQFIRQDGPTSHFTKRGTPTMGGVVIILATLLGWGAGNLVNGVMPPVSSWLLVFLFVGLGFIGFLDDFIKISKQRSLGLNVVAKITGQLIVGTIFAVLALLLKDKNGISPASAAISLVRDTSINLYALGTVGGVILFVLWANFLIAAWSNATNLTDGLDGLAIGTSVAAFSAYTLIAIWQYYQSCSIWSALKTPAACYDVAAPFDIAVFCVGVVGACFGFLWWNASPAQIFMGDTGSLALGGAFAGISILTHTEFLAVVIGGLWVAIVMSDVIQIGFYKLTHRRVFRMAPLHHHFELLGWKEVTIVIRFWIIAGLCAIAGAAIFYAEWLSYL